MGFVICRVAREHGRSVQSVARDSYALTLWTYLQSEEAERFASFVREYERIDGADMVARGFIQGTKPISDRLHSLQGKMTSTPRNAKTREELQRHAEEQYARHHGLKIREH